MYFRKAWMLAGWNIVFLTGMIKPVFANEPDPGIPFMYAEPAMRNNRLSQPWIDAIKSRLDTKKIDSLAGIVRPLSSKELAWKQLIESRLGSWNSFRDSLLVPFDNISCSDTIRILLGSRWVDDGFTFGYNTVCFDLTALQENYGDASHSDNLNRIDRLFAHEFTHLIHKTWFRESGYRPVSFRDSIFWECIYEGLGMFRSLSSKWLPVNGVLPVETHKVMTELTPVLKSRILAINSGYALSAAEKVNLQSGLSRGPVNKKWGAFTIAIWLALEAGGDERKLISLLQKNPEEAVQYLLAKYN